MGWNGIRGGTVTFTQGLVLAGAALLALVPAAGRAQVQTPARHVVDTPTAGTSPVGAFETRTKAFPGGGLEVRVDIGLTHWLSLGGSYGGLQIIGDGDPDWNPEPGFAVKLRVMQETFFLPAVAVGVDTQGGGYWDSARDRYQFQSRGIYAVASKNYAWYGDLTFHGGLNRSLEGSDENINPFLGMEKSIAGLWAISLEYDSALNDNRDDGAYGKGRGYLNGALSWDVSPQMEVRFVVRDMLRNAEPAAPEFTDVIVDEGWGREFTFTYIERF
ncbi:MAG: hypothetical protein HKN12_05220 [Gemmatimonadetes bacterium]|nr:hypothetical protein [Gemmatimonadota bacterium]